MQNRRTLIVVVSVVLAVVAGIVAYIYVSGADDRASEKVQLTKVYVAQVAIPKGTTGEVAAASLTQKDFLTESLPPGTIQSPTEIQGQTAVADIPEGTPITTTLFSATGAVGNVQSQLDAAEGMEAVALPLDGVKGVNGLIQPGDRINLVISGSGTGQRAAYFMQNVKVLAVGTTTSSAPAAPPAGGTATAPVTSGGALVLEVNPIDVQRLVEAQVTGQQVFATLIPAAYQPPATPTATIGPENLLDPAVAEGADPNFPAPPVPNPKKSGSKSSTSTTTAG